MDEWLKKYSETLSGKEDTTFTLGLTDEIPTNAHEYKIAIADYGARRFDDPDALEIARQFHRIVKPGGFLIIRLKSVRDPSYANANRVETDRGLVMDKRGNFDRYFDETQIVDFFGPFFRIESLCEELMDDGNAGVFVFVGCFERI